jgi:hypothetical protein
VTGLKEERTFSASERADWFLRTDLYRAKSRVGVEDLRVAFLVAAAA